MQCSPKTNEFGEITQSKGQYAIQGHFTQGHQFWYQSKAHDSHSLLPTYLLSCTVSKLWLIIGQIFVSNREVTAYSKRELMFTKNMNDN